MADVHECEQCGLMCDCEGEDTYHGQTDDCLHLMDPDECPAEGPSVGEMPESVDDEDERLIDSVRRLGVAS